MSKSNMEEMLFDYGTTYSKDFRNREVGNVVVTTYKPKPTCIAYPRPPPLKDVHTLTNWKASIPFNLFHKPKDIVGTNPSKLQKPIERNKDADLEAVIKTRPRLVMTPAVSIDDVTDPAARAILVDDMYTSNAMRASRGIVPSVSNVKAPLPDRMSPANPIQLRQLQPPMVSPEWRMDSVSWDARQLRSYCPQTRLFWQRREMPRCEKCEESAAVVTQRNMQRQMVTKNC